MGEAMSEPVHGNLSDPGFNRSTKSLMALYIDFENIVSPKNRLGTDNRITKFHLEPLVNQLGKIGKLVVKKAYAPWRKFDREYVTALHHFSFELIEVPYRSDAGKNSADIMICSDALQLGFCNERITTFVFFSNDSDFSPMFGKLKELGKQVVVIGLEKGLSDRLRRQCDEFWDYEKLVPPEIPIDHYHKVSVEPSTRMVTIFMDELFRLYPTTGNESPIKPSEVKQSIVENKTSNHSEEFEAEWQKLKRRSKATSTMKFFLDYLEKKNLITLDKDTPNGVGYLIKSFVRDSQFFVEIIGIQLKETKGILEKGTAGHQEIPSSNQSYGIAQGNQEEKGGDLADKTSDRAESKWAKLRGQIELQRPLENLKSEIQQLFREIIFVTRQGTGVGKKHLLEDGKIYFRSSAISDVLRRRYKNRLEEKGFKDFKEMLKSLDYESFSSLLAHGENLKLIELGFKGEDTFIRDSGIEIPECLNVVPLVAPEDLLLRAEKNNSLEAEPTSFMQTIPLAISNDGESLVSKEIESETEIQSPSDLNDKLSGDLNPNHPNE